MDIALDSVIPYGWAILPDGTFISPKGKVMDVRLVCRSRGGYQARSKSSNYLFWSGSDPAEFLERFWFAEKLVR